MCCVCFVYISCFLSWFLVTYIYIVFVSSLKKHFWDFYLKMALQTPNEAKMLKSLCKWCIANTNIRIVPPNYYTKLIEHFSADKEKKGLQITLNFQYIPNLKELTKLQISKFMEDILNWCFQHTNLMTARSIESRSSGETLLHFASSEGFLLIVKKLIYKGANPDGLLNSKE